MFFFHRFLRVPYRFVSENEFYEFYDDFKSGGKNDKKVHREKIDIFPGDFFFFFVTFCVFHAHIPKHMVYFACFACLIVIANQTGT